MFEQLTEAVAQQKSAGAAMGQKHDQVSSQVTALQETTTRHETELGALRGETTSLRAETVAIRGDTAALRTEAKEFSTTITQQMDGVSTRARPAPRGAGRIEIQHLGCFCARWRGFIERLDRQAEVIRVSKRNAGPARRRAGRTSRPC